MIDSTLFDDNEVVPASERCRYPSKFCRHRRSRKRNGELHRFCDHHRNKANSNQKRWSKSRRDGARGHAASGVSLRYGGSDSDASASSEPPQSPLPKWAVDTPSLEDEEEMDQLAAASPSFTSLLTLLQPRPFNPKLKREASSDDQLSDFLRDLLVPLDDFPFMGIHAASHEVAPMDELEGFQVQL